MENNKIIKREFYQRNTQKVAKDLLGKKIVRNIIKNDNTIFKLSGFIVETEAYGFKNDKSSHAYNGITKRNQVMFGQVGRSYVYFTYGNHYCFNIVSYGCDVKAGAVLIRAIEPIEGIEVMKKNRKIENIHSLASGPGKLTQAFQINNQHNDLDLTYLNNEIHVEEGIVPDGICVTKRIGIKNDVYKFWRFIMMNKHIDGMKINKHVSRKKENSNYIFN
ncbi:MAG: DNA-3-methyladenine glycosylase [Nitrososphaeraceae archaeon]